MFLWRMQVSILNMTHMPEVDSNISETAIFAAINSQFRIRFSRFTTSSNRLKSLL